MADAGIGRRTGRILFRTGKAFIDDNVSRLGAALAFYTTVAVAPLLIVAIAVAGLFFHGDTARDRLVGEIIRLAGPQAGEAVKIIQNPAQSPDGGFATTLGVFTLIFGAFGVFYHLQEALNSIWRTEPPPSKGWWYDLRRRLFSLATVLATGFLLLVSLIASAALSWANASAFSRFNLPANFAQGVNFLLSFVIVTFLFAMIFKLLPDTPVKWRHVWLGAAVTAVLFAVGKGVLGAYLGRASVTSAYGAAGSLVALLLWCYYAAQIVFLGAEFTRVTALSDGGRDFSPMNAPHQKTRNVESLAGKPKAVKRPVGEI